MYCCLFCKKEIKNFSMRHISFCKEFSEYIKSILSKEKIRELYIKEEWSINEISEKYHISWLRVRKLLKEYNIDFRNFEKACKTTRKKNKFEETCIEKYGTKNVLSRGSGIREKMELNVIEKYGVDNVFQLEEVKQKIKETCIERYGENHWMKTDEGSLCIKNILNSKTEEEWKTIIKKRKQTNLEKYGFPNPNQNEEVKEKIKQTNLKRYGVPNPNQNKTIIEKREITNLERYGFKNPTQSDIVKEKIVQTNLKRYGVEYPFLLNVENRFTTPHRKIVKLLNENNINNEIEKKIKCYWVDILLENRKIIEIYGDYWHANPLFYKPEDLIKKNKKFITASEIWKSDRKREESLKRLKYELLVIWEHDINRNLENVKGSIWNFLGLNL